MKRIWLKKHRTSAGFTQLEIATYCNITRSYYSQIELGMKTPNVDIAKRLGEKLQFNWAALYEESAPEIFEKLIAN
ncbi:MAG: helix-turn-helix transcriptional regulator [Bacillota bacterium]|nr:helix-turn-helix transcriptional regulator [Bacillota bacterium]